MANFVNDRRIPTTKANKRKLVKMLTEWHKTDEAGLLKKYRTIREAQSDTPLPLAWTDPALAA